MCAGCGIQVDVKEYQCVRPNTLCPNATYDMMMDETCDYTIYNIHQTGFPRESTLSTDYASVVSCSRKAALVAVSVQLSLSAAA